MSERIQMLTEFLAQNPKDAFARYGLAMEYSKAGELAQAMREFNTLLEHHPDYSAGYFMAAQALHKAGKTDEAKGYLRNGTLAAGREGNRHAQSEMEAMLDELESSG
jgi:predicted Zn-dependent protease